MSNSLSHIQTSFNAGEWSPRVAGRFDLGKYANACSSLDNFGVLVAGPIARRPGTRFINSTKDDGAARLIPFVFSVSQSYVIEFGELYVRFFRNRTGPLLLGVPFEVVSPYTFAQAENVAFTQSLDILYLCHPLVKPQQLNRFDDTDWTFTDFDYRDGPYNRENTTTTTLNPSGTSGSITVTASSIVGINDDEGFKSTDVGRLIRFQDNMSLWSWMEITAFTSTTIVTALIRGPDLSSSGSQTTWRLGAWSDTEGWPSTVTFHQGRLWFAGTISFPNTIWSSVTGDFTNFQPSPVDGTVADDDAITLSLADESNIVRWIQSASKGLMVGTQGGEHLVAARSSLDPITPSTIASSRQGSIGSARIPVEPVAGSLLFVQRANHKVHELYYRFSEDEYIAPEVTLFAEHLGAQSKIRQVSFQQELENIYWTVHQDGTLASMTILRDQDVNAWQRQTIGASLAGPAFVESIASIPDVTHDLVYLIVKRTINGVVRRFVEFIEDRFPIGSDIDDAYFVDAGLSFDGSPATVFTGLEHLEGETVSILADGAVRPNGQVSGGQITIEDPPASKVHIGLPYTSTMVTLPIALTGSNVVNGGVDQFKTVSDIAIQFFQTVGAKAGVQKEDGTVDLETIVFRDSEDLMGQSVELFTGFKRVSASAGQQVDARIHIVQDQPLPMTILTLITELKLDKA